jgi:hypothetical protein
MPTDLEQQLPRFAVALDREAPAISVDEILSRGTVAVDVDNVERPAWDHVPLIALSWGDAMPGHRENGEGDASVEVVPTAAELSSRRRVVLRVALAAAAVVVLVVALAAVVRNGDEPAPADVPRTTIPVEPFVGVWLSTDTDGSSQTMQIARSGTDEYQVVMRDEAATAACAGGASTLSGIGRLATHTSLVIAQPELTCDDGTIPSLGPAPQAELANFTLQLDTATGQLGDSFDLVWRREGANVDVDGPATSGGMWPQSTLEEVRAAQERADAGDPDYTWQVGGQLTLDDPLEHIDEFEIVDRFIREVLGWEAYLFNPWEGGDFNASIDAIDGWVDGVLADQRYLRCMPGRTNPLYPQPAESCAPTLDDLLYESVSIDLTQLARQDRDGIWVVKEWRMTAPFAQADSVAVEREGTERLEAFLAARIAGKGAEGHVEVRNDVDVPLLYATTSGAPYERFEIERTDGPLWPDGRTTFSARLFADGDATVVEQEIRWQQSDGLWLDPNATTENGRPIVLSYTSSDGEVAVSAPSTWEAWLPGKAHEQAADVWFGALWHSGNFFGSGERIELVDPVAYDAWCAANGGFPLLEAPADAAAIAQQLIADPNFETTAPVAARVGGVEAVSIDVALAPGGRACGIGMIEISRWIHGLEPGWRLRLYLVDLPVGMSIQTLAITVVAPEERFEQVIEETAPIIDSIEFHPRAL